MEVLEQGWTTVKGLYEWAFARVQELLGEYIDPALAKPVFNAALAAVATTVVLGLVLLVRCVTRRSHKKPRSKQASRPQRRSAPKQEKHSADAQPPKGQAQEAKAAEEEEECEPVPPAEGPAPSMVLSSLFQSPLSHLAVASGLDATKKAPGPARALLVVASTSPQHVRVYTQLGRDTAATTTADALAAQAAAGTPPRALALCCADLRVVSAQRLTPQTVTGLAVAPSGAFVAVAVDGPPALCVFTMADVLAQYADYRRRMGLGGRDGLVAARREPFETYPTATVAAPHGRGTAVAGVVCLESDGAAHVLTSAADTSVAVWSAHDGTLVARTKTNQLANLALAASPDSQFVVFGTRMEDATVWRWAPGSSSSSSSVLAKCMLVRGHHRAVTHVAFGGPAFPWLLATASAPERTLCLRRVSPVWDRGVEPEPVWQARVPRYGAGGRACTLAALAVSPCGRLVAAAHADRVDVLDARTGTRVLCLPAVGGTAHTCAWLGTGAAPDSPRPRRHAVLAVQSTRSVALYDVTAHLPAL